MSLTFFIYTCWIPSFKAGGNCATAGGTECVSSALCDGTKCDANGNFSLKSLFYTFN